MLNLPLVAQAFADGICLTALLWTWRTSTARWSSWHTLIRKLSQWTLTGLSVVWLIMTAVLIGNKEVPGGQLFLAFVLGLALPLLAVKRSVHGSGDTKQSVKLASAGKVRRLVKGTRKPTSLVLGGVPIPVELEPLHFLVAGSTEAGEHLVMPRLLEALQARNDTVIVLDSGGRLLANHFREDTDFIFNPYDDRCVGWSPTAEMAGAWDAPALARSLIPDEPGQATQSHRDAQNLVASVLRKLWEKKRLKLKDFLYYVQVAPLRELTEFLEGTANSSALASEEAFASARAIAHNFLVSYDYLPTLKDSFSIADMIRAEHSGTFFITYRDDQLAALRFLFACVFDVAARTLLAMDSAPGRRVWLILDKLTSIGMVQSLEQFSADAGHAGGCLVIGISSVPQLLDRYGEESAQTILSNIGTRLVLRCPDADTADYMSEQLGEVPADKPAKSAAKSKKGVNKEDSKESEQPVMVRTVSASRIQAYPQSGGLLKLRGAFPLCELKLPTAREKSPVTQSFVERDIEKNPLVRLATGPASLVTKPSLKEPQEDVNILKASRAAGHSRATSKPSVVTEMSEQGPQAPVTLSLKNMGAGLSNTHLPPARVAVGATIAERLTPGHRSPWMGADEEPLKENLPSGLRDTSNGLPLPEGSTAPIGLDAVTSQSELDVMGLLKAVSSRPHKEPVVVLPASTPMAEPLALTPTTPLVPLLEVPVGLPLASSQSSTESTTEGTTEGTTEVTTEKGETEDHTVTPGSAPVQNRNSSISEKKKRTADKFDRDSVQCAPHALKTSSKASLADLQGSTASKSKTAPRPPVSELPTRLSAAPGEAPAEPTTPENRALSASKNPEGLGREVSEANASTLGREFTRPVRDQHHSSERRDETNSRNRRSDKKLLSSAQGSSLESRSTEEPEKRKKPSNRDLLDLLK